MNEKQFSEILEELINAGRPNTQNYANPAQTSEGVRERADIARVLVKYIIFDNEATKRENQYLRKQIEDLSK